MGRLGLKRKILGFIVLGIVALLFAPFVAVQVQEWTFRYRVGRLLADMRALQLHQAGIPEIQAVFMRWNHEDHPTCCWFETDLSLGPMPPGIADKEYLWLRLFRLYGGRAALVKAIAAVEGGKAYKSFQVELEIPPAPSPRPFVLSGAATTVQRFSINDDWRGFTLHPHYLVREGQARVSHPPTPDVLALFDANTDPKDVARLTKFDLSCITRLWPCRRPDQLMPEAAAQYAREEPQLARARKEHVCSPQIIGLMARDADYVGVVAVTRLGPGWGFGLLPTVRLIETFKAGGRWKTGQERGLYIFVDDDTKGAGIQVSLPADVHPDSHFILLAPTGQYEPHFVQVERCGIVPLNPENLQIVRQAIAESLPPTKP